MKRLLFGTAPKKAAVHPLEAGDLCMALPLEAHRVANEGDRRFLATVVDYKKKIVIFFDDGADVHVEVDSLVEASVSDREAARDTYSKALTECKRLAASDPEEIVRQAIEKVSEANGGTLGSDGMVSYTQAAGDEAKEGRLLFEALLANFGSLAQQSPAVRWMQAHWQEVCLEHDVDKSGTISEDEAIAIWSKVAMTMSSVIASKVDVLGAPPRLYRGDLCVAVPSPSPDAADDDVPEPSFPELATYQDSTHVIFFDGPGSVSKATAIQPASAASKEQAILRYTMTVSQLKAVARKPSKQVVKQAIEKVRAQMGGTLGDGGAIDYTQEAGGEAKEGQLLCMALLEHLGALSANSRSAEAIAMNWKVACAQADEDASGTISAREAVAIWDRLVIETTRSVTSKLDQLGVYAVPLLLEPGDFCMVRPIASEASAADPSRLYLATYVDATHAIFFDDGTEEPHEVASIGPATQADKDVAIVKYTTALDQCTRLGSYDEDDVVAEAIEEVKVQMGGTLGKGAKIDYTEKAGDEAKEGRLLVEALFENVGTLWDESRSLRYMMSHWQEVCEEVDTDNSGTISEDEAAQIWQRLLGAYRQMVVTKLQKLGVLSRMISKISEPSVRSSTPAGAAHTSLDA